MKKYNMLTILMVIIGMNGCTQPAQKPLVVSYPEERVSTLPIETTQPIYVPKHFKSVSALEIANILRRDKNVILLDVRTAQEYYQDGRIEGARLIPLSQLPANLNQLDSSKKILVYCRSGNRSVNASQILVDNGFNAYNMIGGILSWRASGLGVVR